MRLLGLLAWVAVIAGVQAAGVDRFASVAADPGPERHPDFPEPGHTGGFGEPTCVECHLPWDPPGEGASLSIDGLPAAARADTDYRLRVSLTHPGMQRAGFQMTARFADSTQAGVLVPVTDRTRIAPTGGILYASHSEAGSHLREDSTQWVMRWTAPSQAGSVWFHVAANAGNGDASPFGDTVYSWSRAVEVR